MKYDTIYLLVNQDDIPAIAEKLNIDIERKRDYQSQLRLTNRRGTAPASPHHTHTTMTTKDITDKFFFFYREDEGTLTEAVTRIISEVKDGVDRMLAMNAHVIENREYMRAEIARLTWTAALAESRVLSKNQKNYLAKLIFESYIH